jgi:hypothetical protein
MHLQQAGNNRQCRNGHDPTPDIRQAAIKASRFVSVLIYIKWLLNSLTRGLIVLEGHQRRRAKKSQGPHLFKSVGVLQRLAANNESEGLRLTPAGS